MTVSQAAIVNYIDFSVLRGITQAPVSGLVLSYVSGNTFRDQIKGDEEIKEKGTD